MSETIPSKPRRRFLPRFSLRTLLILVLLAASGFGLWWKWEPWALDATRRCPVQENPLFPEETKEGALRWNQAGLSACGRYLHAEFDVEQMFWQPEERRPGDLSGIERRPRFFDLEAGTATPLDGEFPHTFTAKGGWLLRPASLFEPNRMRSCATGEEISDAERPFRFLRSYGRIAVSPDDRFALVEEKAARGAPSLFDLEGMESGVVFDGLVEGQRGVQFSRTGKYVWGESYAGLWETATGKRVLWPWPLDKEWSVYIVSPDETKLVATRSDAEFILYDIEKRKEIAACAYGDFSPDGELYVETLEGKKAGLSSGFLAVVREIETWREVTRYPVISSRIEFTADGRFFCADEWFVEQGNERCAAFYETRTGRQTWMQPRTVRLMPDARRALVWSKKLGVREVVDVESGWTLASLQEPEGRGDRSRKPLDAVVLREGHAAALVYDTGIVEYWDRRRPEWWWGAVWLPEFWLTAVFGLALIWSLVRDVRTLRRAPA